MNEFELEVLRKIDEDESLKEHEIKTLVWDYEIEREEGDEGRWQRYMTSIVEVGGRHFAINWSRGLTEYQENEYDDQPYEVRLHEYEKTIKVREWKKVK